MSPIIAALLPTLTSIIDKIIPDKEASAKAQMELQAMIIKGELDAVTAQLEVNKAEAQNPNLFVSGWRPAVGWTCVFAFAYTFVLLPILSFGYTTYTGHALPVEPPKMDEGLYELLFGMLGLGALRTYEKVKGVSK